MHIFYLISIMFLYKLYVYVSLKINLFPLFFFKTFHTLMQTDQLVFLNNINFPHYQYHYTSFHVGIIQKCQLL